MKPAHAFCILILALLPVLAWASESGAPPSATPSQSPVATPRESLEAFRKQHRALIADVPQAWRVRFAPRDAIPAPTIDTLQNLSTGLLDWLDSLPVDQPDVAPLITSWTSIFKDVFTLRIMLEWQSFEPAWQEFGLLQPRLLERSSRLPHEHVAKATAALAAPILRLWVQEQHDTLLPWMEKFEIGWLADPQGQLPSWWLKNRSDYAMSLTGKDSSFESSKVGEQWIFDYLADSSTPLDRRTSLVSRHALHMHSIGHAERAGTILAWWEKQHPKATAQDVRFLHIQFFVRQVGHGNREAAREVLALLDVLVESGALSPEDDRFRVVTQNYYRNLQHSDLDHTILMAQLLESRSTNPNE